MFSCYNIYGYDISRRAGRPAREGEILEELSEHLEQRYHEFLQEGLDEAEARRRSILAVRTASAPRSSPRLRRWP